MFTLCGSLCYCFLSLRPSWFVNLLFKMFHLLIKPYLVSHPFVHLSLFFSDVDIHPVSSCHRNTPFTVRSPWKHLCAWHTLASVRLKRRFIVPPLLLPLFHFVLVTPESSVPPVSPSLLCLGGLFPTLHRSQLTSRPAVFHQTAESDVQDEQDFRRQYCNVWFSPNSTIYENNFGKSTNLFISFKEHTYIL